MTHIPYTYIIKCIPTQQYYYGVRYAKNCHPDDLWATYFTSSLYVKKLIQEYGKQSFQYEVRKTFTNIHKARKWEERVLRYLKVSQRGDFLNMYDHMHFGTTNRSWINNGKISKLVDSICVTEYVSRGWQRGRLFTEKHKTNISHSKKGTNSGSKNPMYGKKHTSDTKDKIKNRRGNKPHISKINVAITQELLKLYEDKSHITIPAATGSGKQLTYEGAFCRHYANIYNVSSGAIKNVIRRKTLLSRNIFNL